MMRSRFLVKSLLGALLSLGLMLSVAATAAQARVLKGELVRQGESSQRFRLVDNAGTFTAPAGVDLAQFEGMPVEVEVDANGKVQSISQMSMQIEPVVHGFTELSGSLVPIDPVAGTFSLAGDSRQFTAPPGVDVRAYANKLVRVRLDEHGHVSRLSPAAPPAAPAAVPAPTAAPAAKECMYAGAGYSSGAPLCQSGMQYVCENGEWRNLGTSCTPAVPHSVP